MILILLIATSSSCTFETAFEKGGEDATQSSFGANLDRFCFGEDETKRALFLKGYEAGRESAATLKEASIKDVPSSQDDLDRLLERADRILRMQQLRQEVADRDQRIQQLEQSLQNNNNLLRSQNQKLDELKEELKKAPAPISKTQK